MPKLYQGMLMAGAVAALVGGLSLKLPAAPATMPADRAVAPSTAASAFVALNLPYLPNAHRINDKLISGAQPEGEEGFKELAALGVKTIISVDGLAPDAETAHKYGMRYVHLPFGYDTVPVKQGEAIAHAIDELPGPIYIHCHHGKHRSAAAVAVACVLNGMIRQDQAEDVLKTFGTGENYKGLWASALEARLMDPKELAALHVDYVEKAKIPPLAESMVMVDQRADHLKQLQAAGWKPPADHPDLDPAHEALQLEELFTEIGRSESAAALTADFRARMQTARQSAEKLKEQLLQPSPDPAAINATFQAVNQSCTACHAVYRD